MKKIVLILTVLFCSALGTRAQYYSVNVDVKTTAAMFAALTAEWGTEEMSRQAIEDILDEYTAAEVATAGIFLTKWMDRKAMKDAGLFSSEENYYYKRIYDMVSNRIMPKIWDVACLMVEHPDKALFWGPYLYKVTTEVKQLCMQFETVVTNGRLSFKDIAWLAINDDLLFLFDLAQLGNVDWEGVWDRLTEFDFNLAKEDLKLDLDNLLQAGSALAGAGVSTLDSLWVNASKVGEVFHMKPKELWDLGNEFKDMYEELKEPANVQNLLLSQIGSADSLGVANLFQWDSYNISNYMSNYINSLANRYYKQRWYIYYRDSGSELVSQYTPDTSVKDNITYGRGEWTRFDGGSDFYPTSSQLAQVKSNGESYAGWSQSRVNELNRSQNEYTYSIYYSLNSYYIWRGSQDNVIGHSYAYDITVYRSWNNYGEVYEEWFDSQTMDERVFEAHMQQKLVEAKMQDQIDNSSDVTAKNYQIGKDSKQYYSQADEKKLQGCYTVNFVMNCEGGAKLGEGSFQWKVNPHHSPLNNDSKEYAMSTTLEEGEGMDTSTYDERIQELRTEIAGYDAEIVELEAQIKQLQIERGEADPKDYAAIDKKITKCEDRIRDLKGKKSTAQSNLDQVDYARTELINDYAGETDDVYRIPAVMHELAATYQISWLDEGHWVGYTFVRRGQSPSLMNSVIEFTADLVKVRGESWFLFIRYHRSILGVNWALKTDYSSSDVVDIMTFGDDTTEKERADAVSARQRELMEDHPGCTIELEYEYSQPDVKEDEDDEIHLLWVSDRLAIAREVDYRLTKIYANLVLVEKFLYSKRTIGDFLKAKVMNAIEQGLNRRRSNESFERWREATYNALESDSTRRRNNGGS